MKLKYRCAFFMNFVKTPCILKKVKIYEDFKGKSIVCNVYYSDTVETI